MEHSSAFRYEHENPLPMCAELILSASQGSTRREVVLNAELRCGEERISDGEVGFTIRLKKGLLVLELDGCEIASGLRFGELQREPFVTRTLKQEDETERSVKSEGAAKGSAALNHTLKLEAGISGSGSIEGEEHVTSKEYRLREVTEVIRRVTALGGNAWEIVEPDDDQCLKGMYLGHEALCNVSARRVRFTIKAFFKTYQKDIVVDSVRYRGFTYLGRILGNNKEKLIAIVVGKALRTTNDELVICSSMLQTR